jgi:hypothetical protein
MKREGRFDRIELTLRFRGGSPPPEIAKMAGKRDSTWVRFASEGFSIAGRAWLQEYREGQIIAKFASAREREAPREDEESMALLVFDPSSKCWMGER